MILKRIQNEDLYLWLSAFLNGCYFSSIPKTLVKVRMSSELCKRRGNFKCNWDTYKLRNKIISLLKLNKFNYFYNLLAFLSKLIPSILLVHIYKIR